MTDTGGFQEQVRRLSELVTQLERLPVGAQRDANKELIQLLMEVHGRGLERMMEIIFESPEGGTKLIDRLAKDEAAGGLLLLYSLHPDALEARVLAALERMRPRLLKLACTIELVSISQGSIQLSVTRSGHSCGSSAKELRAIIENGILELAPDLSALDMIGLDEQPSAGFVSLETLLTGAGAAAGAPHH